MAAPAEFTEEHHWGWKGPFLERVPFLEQPQLESWCGAAHRADVPAGTNRYLMSTMGTATGEKLRTIDRAQVFTVDRAMVVSVASGMALLAGLLLIYVPVIRHPVTLLVVAVLLGMAALVEPEATLLVSQAASLGVVLALVAAALRKNALRLRRSRGRGASALILDRSSSRYVRRPAAAGNDATTEIMTDMEPVPVADSQE